MRGGRAARRSSPNRVNHNTKSMSRSSRLDETGGRVLKHCKLQYEINLFGLRSPLGPSWAPGPSSIVQAMWPKMVFGHNLQHMAPFGIPTSGFCMVFQYGSLIFSTPGPILGPQDLDLGSGWAGDLLGAKTGARKTCFCAGNGLPWGRRGICARGLDCMVPRRALGRPVSP